MYNPNKPKLKGKIKKFDIKLFNKYDIPARNIIKEKLNVYVKDNPNIFEEDLLLDAEGCKYKYIEIQVRVKWINDKYPDDLPYIYERKKHFSPNTLYIILNKNMDQGLLFNKEALFNKPVRERKYSKYFIYCAQWNKVLRFNIKDLDIDLIKTY